MGTLKAYAGTTVSLFKTQEDIEKLLAQHKILASRWTHFAELANEPGLLRFEFEWRRNDQSPVLSFRIEVGYKYKAGPRGGNQGTTREQAGRALFWHIKNLFEAVEFGIVDLEQAFLPYMLTPGTEATVYDNFREELAAGPLTTFRVLPERTTRNRDD